MHLTQRRKAFLEYRKQIILTWLLLSLQTNSDQVILRMPRFKLSHSPLSHFNVSLKPFANFWVFFFSTISRIAAVLSLLREVSPFSIVVYRVDAVSFLRNILKYLQKKVTFSISFSACLGFLSENKNKQNKTIESPWYIGSRIATRNRA